MSGDWVPVAEASDLIELALLRGLLEGARVRVEVRPRGLKSLQGALGGAANLPGAYELRVPPEDVYFARQLLAAEPEAEPETE